MTFLLAATHSDISWQEVILFIVFFVFLFFMARD